MLPERAVQAVDGLILDALSANIAWTMTSILRRIQQYKEEAMDNKCFRCKASLEGAEIVPQSNYSLVYCPKCGTINERGDE